MPLTLLDFILLAIMLVSGLLALMRGFTREVLSLVAWGAAAVAAYFAIKQPGLIEWAKANVPYLEKDILAQIAVGARDPLATLSFILAAVYCLGKRFFFKKLSSFALSNAAKSVAESCLNFSF